MSIAVNVENSARAESDRMFASFAGEAGGVNRLSHHRAPTAVDRQPVIRMNRDTLYSAAVVDISEGAHLTIPDGGRRYVSVMGSTRRPAISSRTTGMPTASTTSPRRRTTMAP